MTSCCRAEGLYRWDNTPPLPVGGRRQERSRWPTSLQPPDSSPLLPESRWLWPEDGTDWPVHARTNAMAIHYWPKELSGSQFFGGREQNHPPEQHLSLGKHSICLCQKLALNIALFPLLIVQLHLTTQYQSPSSKNTMIPPYLLVITIAQFKDHMEGHTSSTIKQGNTVYTQKKWWDMEENPYKLFIWLFLPLYYASSSAGCDDLASEEALLGTVIMKTVSALSLYHRSPLC